MIQSLTCDCCFRSIHSVGHLHSRHIILYHILVYMVCNLQQYIEVATRN
jgi:hypothetical protein